MSTDDQGFPSLAALRARHAELARSVGREAMAGKNPTLVTEFVAKAVATGRVLDAKEDRASAQGLIGYWTARLVTAGRESARAALTGDGSGGAASQAAPPELDDTLLTDFDPDTLDQTADSATRLVASLSDDDKVVVRRILQRLVRLRSNESVFDPVQTPLPALYDCGDTGRVDGIVRRLEEVGAIRVSTADPSAVPQVGLRSPALAAKWADLRDAQEERLQFRARAVAPAPPAAPAGPLRRVWGVAKDRLAAAGRWQSRAGRWVRGRLGLRPELEPIPVEHQDVAEEYNDLNEEEVRFLRVNRSLQRKRTDVNRAQVGLMFVAVVITTLATLSAWREREKTEREREKTERLREKAEEQRLMADSATAVVTKQRDELRRQQDELLGQQKQIDANLGRFRKVLDALVNQKGGGLSDAEIDEYKKLLSNIKSNQEEVATLRDTAPPLRPGTLVWVKGAAGRELGSSVCCLLRAADGRRFVLVYGPGDFEGDANASRDRAGQRPIGRVLRPAKLLPTGVTLGGPADTAAGYAAFIELDPAVEADNLLYGLKQPFSGVAAATAVGAKVELLGSGSGHRRGQVTRVKPDGQVAYTRISTVGDTGGPVFDDRRQLIAMHVGAGVSESFGVLVHPLLTALKLDLVP